jgi:hypothetical protein
MPLETSEKWIIGISIVIVIFITIAIPGFHQLFTAMCNSAPQDSGYFVNNPEARISNITTIDIDRTKYAKGQVVHVLGQSLLGSYNSTTPYNDNVRIEVKKTHKTDLFWCYYPLLPNEMPIVHSVFVSLKNGTFNYDYITEDAGKYIITSTNSNLETNSGIRFEVVDILYTHSTFMLFVAVAFFVALAFLLLLTSQISRRIELEQLGPSKRFSEGQSSGGPIQAKSNIPSDSSENKENNDILYLLEKAEIFRFLFISGIVWSFLAAIILADVEIGTNSPFGLVQRHELNPQGQSDLEENNVATDEWIINIGGSWEDNFSSGIIIPIYVLVLGLLGGYLRYLHKAVSKELKKQDVHNEREKTSYIFHRITNGELSHIFLAPLLAAIVWFLLSRGEIVTNIYILAGISFSVGLVTTEIIDYITKYTTSIVSKDSKIHQ